MRISQLAERTGVPEARGLLDRGFARISEDDRATGDWANDVTRLAHAAAVRDSALMDLAAQVTELAARQLGSGHA